MLRAVVTAGGRIDGAFAAAAGTPVKALAPFGSGTLLGVVLGAIAGAGIEDVAVVGDAAVAAAAMRLSGRVRAVPADADGGVNVLRALDAWPDGDLLYATSDLPFVDAAALSGFLAACAGCDLAMPLAEAGAYAAAYPGAPAHATALADGRVANGSVFFVSAAARPAIRTLAVRFFSARKSALAMARLLGPGLLLRFLTRRLRIADIEDRAGRVLGLRARGIREAAPSLCYDVDTLEDYRDACARR